MRTEKAGKKIETKEEGKAVKIWKIGKEENMQGGKEK